MSKKFEQSVFSFIQLPPPVKAIDKTSPQKKPFVQPLLQAVDRNELKSNFMYLLRILINSANRQPNQPDSQRSFAHSLLSEMKIKKGFASLDVEARSAILQSSVFKK